MRISSLCYRVILSLVIVILGANPVFSQVRIEAFGAIGDGITDDTTAFNQAAANAGPNATILGTPGKAYILCGVVEITALGQTWDGRDSTIQRCDSPNTQLAIDFKVGDTFLHVTDASGFRVGHSVAISPDGTGNHLLSHRYIQSIKGNIMTLSCHLGGGTCTVPSNLPVGSPMELSLRTLSVRPEAENVTIKNWIFVGNDANNSVVEMWQTDHIVKMAADGGRIVDNVFIDIPGDAIATSGKQADRSIGLVVENNVVLGIDGSFIHFSLVGEPGGTGVEGAGIVVRGNRIFDGGREFKRVNHADGIFESSLNNYDVLIENNCIEGAQGYALSQENTGLNRKWIFRNNLIHNAVLGAFEIRKARLNVDGPPDDPAQFVIEGNISYNDTGLRGSSQIRTLTHADASQEPMADVVVRNNKFYNEMIFVNNVNNLEIIENHFILDIPNSDLSFPSSIFVRGGWDITISSNVITGGERGISIANRSGVDAGPDMPVNDRLQNAQLDANQVSVDSIGFLLGDSLKRGHLSKDYDMREVSITNNVIKVMGTAQENIGMWVGAGANIKRNCFKGGGIGVLMLGSDPSDPITPAGSVSYNQSDALISSIHPGHMTARQSVSFTNNVLGDFNHKMDWTNAGAIWINNILGDIDCQPVPAIVSPPPPYCTEPVWLDKY